MFRPMSKTIAMSTTISVTHSFSGKTVVISNAIRHCKRTKAASESQQYCEP